MIPETSNRPDWPRLVKLALDTLNRRLRAQESRFAALGNFADDTAAAAGGIPVGGLYRTASAVKVRVT